MKYFRQTYFCFYVIMLCSYDAGLMAASDPAPGRSPGPPPSDYLRQNHRSLDNVIMSPLNEIKEQHQLTNTIEEEKFELPSSDNSDDPINEDKNTTMAHRPAESDSNISNSSNKCVVSAASYIFPSKQIFKVKAVETAFTPPLKLHVIHELFDTKIGIVNSMLYIVQVNIITPGSISNFYMETLVDDIPAGHFINLSVTGTSSGTDSSSDKWYRTPYSNKVKVDNLFATNVAVARQLASSRGKLQKQSDTINDSIADAKDDSDLNQWLLRNAMAKMKIPKNYSNEKSNDGESDESCDDANVWIERIVLGVNHKMNWFINKPNFKNKTVKFRILYRKMNSSAVFETIYEHQLLDDCVLSLTKPLASLDYTQMPLFNNYDNCTVFFPSLKRHDTSMQLQQSTTMTNVYDTAESPPAGLLVELTRLNVPCGSGGYILIGSHSELLCGKLEDLLLNDRRFYFPAHINTSILLHRKPLFRLNYKLVDYCYNVTLTDRNGSYFVQPDAAIASLECFISIHLPYGYRIELNIWTNMKRENHINPMNDIRYYNNDEDSSDEISKKPIDENEFGKNNKQNIVETEFIEFQQYQHQVDDDNFEFLTSCNDGLAVTLEDSNGEAATAADGSVQSSKWCHCISAYSAPRKFNVISSGNKMFLRVKRTMSSKRKNIKLMDKDIVSLYLNYVALPVPQLVSHCAFGWVAKQQLCLTAVNDALPWSDAEAECVKRGGHLVSIQSERDQRIIDQFLLNSSNYTKYSAYWIGASDTHFEGDFLWSNGLPFKYKNWFRGWPEHNNYNKQPNDDGLSGQDCVEIRRYFREPPGTKSGTSAPLSPSFMWNDRDCSSKNLFLCERPMSNEPHENINWANGCNKTIFLTRERQRASLWSPGFPQTYPDNINCFTIVIAPPGFNIVLEFEEFYLEDEQDCSYDFLEIIDTKVEEPNYEFSIKDLYRKNWKQKPANFNGNKYEEELRNESVSNVFENFLNIYKPHASVVMKLPKPNEYVDEFLEDKQQLPYRVCGDWSSKLKLLYYVTTDALLGLHFVSDYSHHFSGYKAKVTIKNASSECPDERLKPFNSTCYLFVSYPEVDWQTAQSVCRGIGAQLASVSSPDEQRFIVTNVRNQLDYSEHTTYWLGGELAKNKEFEWADGMDMTFLGWLPGQEVIDIMPTDPTCLGLQWKVSPTPMLPTSLYWTAQKCMKYGGYICKSKKQKVREKYMQNKTIAAAEGRLTSPGYPNTYPLNVDYWVRIEGQNRTRLVLQFQIIDLEPQDECLYDYVSVQESVQTDDYNQITMPKHSTIDEAAAFTPQQQQNPFISAEVNKWFLSKNHQGHSQYYGRSSQHEQNKKRSVSMGKPTTATIKHMNPTFSPYVRWCGSHNANMSRFDFVSMGNSVLLHFHSDHSLSGTGFSIVWNAVDVSGCPLQTLTGNNGTLFSPNYPNFLLNNLDCSWVIQSESGQRIWLEFSDYEVMDNSVVDLDLGNGWFSPFLMRQQLNDGLFVSRADRIVVRLRTGAEPKGRGFRAVYRTMKSIVNIEHSMTLNNVMYGSLHHLNYPQLLPNHINYTQHIMAPLGHVILMDIYGVGFSESHCHGSGSLEVYDNYADINGTVWHLCELTAISNGDIFHFNDDENDNSPLQYSIQSPVHITSYLNTIHIRQTSESGADAVRLNATIRIQPDLNYKYKLASHSDKVESCKPNPCQFGGICIENAKEKRCQCVGHYTGRFCGLNMCELEPCIFGKCELIASGFKCLCHKGYIGRTCDQRQQPCALNPCEGRGDCINKNGGFFCRCHAWWEGQRCELRMARIPYKPLSDRMLQEPFWLGLITVFVVLAFIGLVWCAKRHFPEKIEKLLAEEAERNRPPGIPHGHHHHHQSLREQLQFTSAVPPQSVAMSADAPPRTIFGRLGIRKPSIMSLSSPNPTGGETARTFSLDDLLRPPPRRKTDATRMHKIAEIS